MPNPSIGAFFWSSRLEIVLIDGCKIDLCLSHQGNRRFDLLLHEVKELLNVLIMLNCLQSVYCRLLGRHAKMKGKQYSTCESVGLFLGKSWKPFMQRRSVYGSACFKYNDRLEPI